MLSGIRKGLNSFLVMALLGILIASFAIWGVGDVFRTPTLTVAEVGDAEISANDFLREFESRVNSFRVQFGGDFDRQQARAMGIDRFVLAQMVSRTAWDEEAREMGLVGSDERVAETLRNIEAFQGVTGRFDRFTYQQALRRIGLTFKEFEAQLANEAARNQLLETVQVTTPLPESYVRQLYRYRKEARTARVLTIPTASVGAIEPASEQTLREYHELNQALFMAPEYRNLTFLILRPGDFVDGSAITEGDLRAAYEERINDYQIPEKRDLSVVTFTDAATAREFHERVSSGEDFETVAGELTGFSPDELAIGERGYFELRADYSEAAAEDVFALAAGEISQPVQTILGWYVFRVEGIEPGSERSFEEVRDELRDVVAGERGIDVLYDTAARIDDRLAEGFTVAEIAGALELPVQSFPAIDRSGLKPDGELVSSDPDILPYLQYAFTLRPDEEPILMEEEQRTGFYLVQVNDIIEPELRPFETVEDEVRARWLADERNKKAGELADGALREAQVGVPLEDLAEKYRGELFDAPRILRDEMLQQKVLARNIADLVFSLEIGEVGMERAATGEGYVLVEVTSITPGDPQGDPDRLAALREELEREINGDTFAQYQAGLQNDLGVTINRQLIEDLFDPDSGVGVVRRTP